MSTLFAILVIAVIALGAAVLSILYAYFRLRPGVLAVRASVNEAVKIASASKHQNILEGWRNDERRLSRTADKNETAIRKLENDAREIESSRLSDYQAFSAKLARLESGLERLRREAEDARKESKSIIGSQAEHKRHFGEIDEQIETLEKQLGQLERQSDEVGRSLTEQNRLTASALSEIEKNPVANASKALTHKRLLPADSVSVMVKDLAPKLALELTERHLYHLAHRVCLLESSAYGRLATSIEAITVRILAALHLTRDRGSKFTLLEIGTLYGIGGIALYDSVRFRSENKKLIVIDPLDGYYESEAQDFVAMAPVTRSVLEANLTIARVPQADTVIIQEKSESPESLQALADIDIDLLVIDGDHSYEGVKRDFENYFPKLRQGGVVIIDDYDVEEWPDIKRYADEKLIPRADIQVLFSQYRTLLLRKM